MNELEQTFVLGLVVTAVILCLLAKWTSIFSRKKYPPGPWGYPIFGHLPLLGRNPAETYHKWRQLYGDVFRIRFGSWKCVIINGYESVKDAAERSDDAFSGRPNFVTNMALKEAYGGFQSISFTDMSPKYLQLRKLTTTAFSNYMRTCEYPPEDLFVTEAEKLVDSLDDQTLPVSHSVELAVENVVYQMLYGKGTEIEIQSHVKLIVESSNAFVKFVSTGNVVDVVPWLRYIMKRKVDDFKKAALATDWITRLKIKEHKESFQRGRTKDILDSFWALSNKLPETDTEESISGDHLIFQATAVQGAGFETTSQILKSLIQYMAAYPEIQSRVQNEIDHVIGSRNVTWTDRFNLPYVNATIQEVLRKALSIPFALPHSTIVDTKLCGYDIEKGTVVFFNLHSIVNEKSFWIDPELFRPERFLNENGSLDVEKCARVLAFGIGRRKCAGESLAKMNIFITFTTLMQRRKFICKELEDLKSNLENGKTMDESCKLLVQRRT